MNKIFVTPQSGVLVRKENGKPLAADGEPVERSSFWLRRERDGDVTIKPVPAAQAAPANEAPALAGDTAKKTAPKA